MEFSEYFCDFPSKSKPISEGDDRALQAYDLYKFSKVDDNPNFAKRQPFIPYIPDVSDDESDDGEMDSDDEEQERRQPLHERIVRGEKVFGSLFYADGFLDERSIDFPDGMESYGRGFLYEYHECYAFMRRL